MSPQFSSALSRIARKDRASVQAWLEDWKKRDPECAQVAENVENETALSLAKFCEFLREAARKWRNGGLDFGTFDETICSQRRRLGFQLKPPKPGWVGRIETLEIYLSRRSAAEPGIPKESFSQELGVSSPESVSLPPQADDEILFCITVEAHPLEPESGSVFATFHEDRSSRPFDGPLRQFDQGLAMLGLGKFPRNAWALAVTYQPQIVDLVLHVPTICDAGTYTYFRPAVSPAGGGKPPEGTTFPLPGSINSHGNPEAVHRNCGWHFLHLT